MALDPKLAERMARRLLWFRLHRALSEPVELEASWLDQLLLNFPEAKAALRALIVAEVFTFKPQDDILRSIFPPTLVSEEALGQQLAGDGPFKIIDKE